MPNRRRMLVDGGCYHLIARGNNRKEVFDTSDGYDQFYGLVRKSQHKWRWHLYHYCFMPNHVHLLAKMENGNDLPHLMQFLLREYSRFYHRRQPYTGYLWEGRYRDFFISKDSYFLECGRYIERNPVRARISSGPEGYAWSSYRHYAYGMKDALITDDWHFLELAKDDEGRRERYRDFVRLENPYERLIESTIEMRPSFKRAKIAA